MSNRHPHPRGNAATRCKESILVDAKEFVFTYMHVFQQLPKIERIDGAARELKEAAWRLVEHFTTAWCCPEARLPHVQRMFGDYARMQAAMECLDRQSLLPVGPFNRMMELMASIFDGLERWHRSLTAASQVRGG